MNINRCREFLKFPSFCNPFHIRYYYAQVESTETQQKLSLKCDQASRVDRVSKRNRIRRHEWKTLNLCN